MEELPTITVNMRNFVFPFLLPLEPTKASAADLKSLQTALDILRRIRSKYAQYYSSHEISGFVKAVARVRPDPAHHQYILECMKELIQFVGWSAATAEIASFAIQRYYAQLIRVLECTKRQQRVQVLAGWLVSGLEQQLTNMLKNRLQVVTNFISKLIKLMGAQLDASVSLENFSRELCMKFVMQNSTEFGLRSALRLFHKLVESQTFVPSEMLVMFLDEGLTGRLVDLLELHTVYDAEALECLHSIGKRLFKDGPQLARVFTSRMLCLNVDQHIEDSTELYALSKKQVQTMVDWMQEHVTLPAWSLN